jgi:hypothetical protein
VKQLQGEPNIKAQNHENIGTTYNERKGYIITLVVKEAAIEP